MSTTVFDLLGRVSADTSPFNSAMDGTASSVESSLASIYKSASRWLGAGGVVGAFYKATEAANEFNQLLADISSITDLQIKNVEKALLRLDNVFGKPVHTANTFYETISSGVKGSTDDIAEYVKTVGKAATVIRADIENTGNAMTTLTNAYDLSVKDIEQVLDFLYLTVREGKAQGNDLARTLGLVINNAAECKISLEELGAAIAILSRTQSASQSMIGLNQMLNAFIKPTLQAQAEAKKWNIELGASALQAKGLTASLEELHAKVGGNVEALEKMFGNIRAGRAILALTGNQFDNFIEVLDEFKRGAGTGEEAFAKQIDTAYKDLVRLRAQVSKTSIQIGKDIEPVTRVVYGLSEAILKGFSDTSALTRYSTYIYIVVAAVSALRKELIQLRTAMSGIAMQPVGQVANATATTSAATTASAITSTVAQQTVDPRIASIRSQIARENKYSKAALATLLKYGPRGDDANREAMAAEEEYALAQRDNASKRTLYNLRRRAQAASRRSLELENRLHTATEMLTRSRTRVRMLEEQEAALTASGQRGGRLARVARGATKMVTSAVKWLGSNSLPFIGIGATSDTRGAQPRTTPPPNLSSISVSTTPKTPSSNIIVAPQASNSTISTSGTNQTTPRSQQDQPRQNGRITSNILSGLGNIVGNLFAAISVADLGYNIGKAIADRYNFAGSSFIKRLAEALSGLPNQDDVQQEVDQHNLDMARQTAESTISRLTKSGALDLASAEQARASIYTATTEEAVSNINRSLNEKYGGQLTENTTKADSLRNANEEVRAKQDVLNRVSQSAGPAITGKALSNFFTTLQGAERQWDDVSAISTQLNTLRAKMAEAVNSGDFTDINNILNIKDIQTLKRSDIAKGLGDAQLQMLMYVIQFAKKAIEDAPPASDASYKSALVEKAQSELNTAISNKLSTEYNFATDYWKKQADVKAAQTGRERADFLLSASSVGNTEDFAANLQYATDKMLAQEELVRNMNTLLKKISPGLTEGARITLDEDLAAEGNKLATARKNAVQAATNYVSSAVESIQTRARDQFNSSIIDSSRVTTTLLSEKAKMQEVIMDELTTEINKVTVKLMRTSSPTEASLLREQLRQFYDEFDSASAEYVTAKRELEEQQLQKLARKNEMGLISNREYMASVQAIYGGRVQEAQKAYNAWKMYYENNPTEQANTNLTHAAEILEAAQLDAAAATKEMMEAQKNAASQFRNASMGQVQGFASERDPSGRMTQNAMYHSLNLLSRIAGPQASFSLTKSPSISTSSNFNYKNAQTAQGAISKTLDAYIMSQKYAEASIGQTVTDIYNYMRQNDEIIVRG